MKICTIPICEDTFISKKNEDKNYSCSESLFIGKCEKDECRTILKFPISKKKIEGKIKKVELMIYLVEIDMAENIECFMLNIGRNIEFVDIREVSFSDAPEFCQQCQIYRLEKCFEKNYLKLDITKIAKSWIKGREKNFGITMLGLCDDSFMNLASSRSKKKSFIKVYIEDEKNNCKSPAIDELIDNNSETNYNSNLIERNIFGRDDIEKVINESRREDICISENEKKLAYGYFFNEKGNLLRAAEGTEVIFDGLKNVKGLELNENKTAVIINKTGIYRIDYGVNCRCDNVDIMQLELNGELICNTNFQVGLCEGMIWGHTIIKVDKEKSMLKLKLLSGNSLLMMIGIAASMTIFKIE